MAANISQGQLRSQVLACRLDQLPNWTLHVACKPCLRQAEITVATLHRPDWTMAQVMMRLRCQGCGQPPTILVGGTRRQGYVRLLGPGAYG